MAIYGHMYPFIERTTKTAIGAYIQVRGPYTNFFSKKEIIVYVAVVVFVGVVKPFEMTQDISGPTHKSRFFCHPPPLPIHQKGPGTGMST